MQPESPAAVFRRYLLAGLAFAGVAGLFYLLYKLQAVLLILAFSGFLAYFLAWPIGLLSRKLPRLVATRIVFYAFFLLVIGSIPTIGAIIYYQAMLFIEALPSYMEQLPQQYEAVNQFVLDVQRRYMEADQVQGLDFYLKQLVEQLRGGAPGIFSNAVGATQSILSGAGLVLGGLVVVPVIALYFLLDAGKFRTALVQCFPPRMHSDLEQALDAINKSLGGYIYSRVVMASFIAIGMAIAMLVLDLPYWLLLALGLFIGEFIPVVGGVLAFIPIAIVCLVSDPVDLLWLIIINLSLQLIQNYIISPKLTGETMNIHPLTVVIAMLVGGSVGGAAGLIIALPAAAALKIIFSVFVFKRDERGITVPKLDQIAASNREAALAGQAVESDPDARHQRAE